MSTRHEYTLVERAIANALARFPFLKSRIKWVYQSFCYIVTEKSHSHTFYKIEKIAHLNQESFFGYYDKSPSNNANTKLIFHGSQYPTRKIPDINKPITVCIKDINSDQTEVVDNTSAYNWQQGSRLQWLDDDRFIFNCCDSGKQKYISKIYSVSNGNSTVIPFPVYDCFNNTAISIDFERLYQLNPDYGYKSFTKKNIKFNITNDGVFLIDLLSGNIKLLLSYSDILDSHSKPTMENAIHKINHLMFSPEGDSFIFLHRWYSHKKKYDALMHYDFKSGICKCLSDDDMVSHCCWKDNNILVCWLRKKDEGDKYYFVSTIDKSRKEIDQKINVYGDGHPSVCNNLILFDSYPDKARLKKLLIYNMGNQQLTNVGQFFEPLKYYGITRCDLHPKWSKTGKSIFVDSVHEGKRQLYELENVNECD